MSHSIRSPYWDNARFILIVLVVFGHLAAMVQDPYPTLRDANTVLAVWRMPLMAFIAGTFSRTERPIGWLERLTVQLLLPYAILQLLFGWYYVEVLGMGTEVRLLRPVHTLWFLLALFWWHLCLPYVSTFRQPVLWSLVVALLAGYLDGIGEKLSLSRALVFMPFFLLGHQLAWRDRAPALRLPATVAVAILLLCGTVLTQFADPHTVLQLARGADSYTEMGLTSAPLAPLARLSVLLMAALCGAAVLSMVPTRRFRWTALGERTIYIYLLHWVLLRSLEHTGLLDNLTTPWLVLILLSLPPFLAWVLSSDAVVRSTSWAVQGRLWWTLKAWWQRRTKPGA